MISFIKKSIQTMAVTLQSTKNYIHFVVFHKNIVNENKRNVVAQQWMTLYIEI